jgi:hypothetical protein
MPSACVCLVAVLLINRPTAEKLSIEDLKKRLESIKSLTKHVKDSIRLSYINQAISNAEKILHEEDTWKAYLGNGSLRVGCNNHQCANADPAIRYFYAVVKPVTDLTPIEDHTFPIRVAKRVRSRHDVDDLPDHYVRLIADLWLTDLTIVAYLEVLSFLEPDRISFWDSNLLTLLEYDH